MSNYINESHIYFGTKKFLTKLGWTIIAGEPSGGSDEIPRIEIRNPINKEKGSKGSYKIDLISIKGNFLLLTEIKVRFDYNDIKKLNDIVNIKIDLLKNALIERLGINIQNKKILKSLALSKCNNKDIPEDFICFKINKNVEIINPNLFPKD